MSEIPYIPPASSPDNSARASERPQAARAASHNDERPQNQTGQHPGRQEQREQAEKSARSSYRDPAVSIAPATAHLRKGDKLTSEVMTIDEDGRPIIVTEKAVLALRPDAGLREGDRIRVEIVGDDRGVRAELKAVNGDPRDPPVELRLTIIALHGYEEKAVPDQALDRTAAGYSPALLKAAAQALENVKADPHLPPVQDVAPHQLDKAEQALAEMIRSPVDAGQQAVAEAATSRTVDARSRAAFVTLELNNRRRVDPANPAAQAPGRTLALELHIVDQTPRRMPPGARVSEVLSIEPATGSDFRLAIAEGTINVPASVGANLTAGNRVLLVPGAGVKWPTSFRGNDQATAAILTRPVLPGGAHAPIRQSPTVPLQVGAAGASLLTAIHDGISPVAAGVSSAHLTGSINPGKQEAVQVMQLIPLTPSGDAPRSSADSGHVRWLQFALQGRKPPQGALPLKISSAVPMLPEEIKVFGLPEQTGFRPVRLSTSGGQFAVSIPRGMDPTREQAFMVADKPAPSLSATSATSQPGVQNAQPFVGVLTLTANPGDERAQSVTQYVEVQPASNPAASATNPTDPTSPRYVTLNAPYEPASASGNIVTLQTSAGSISIDMPTGWPRLAAGASLQLSLPSGAMWPPYWPGGGIPGDVAASTVSTSLAPPLGDGNWAAPGAAVSILGGPTGSKAGAALASRSAGGGIRLTNSLLFMMNALGVGNPDTWIGDSAAKGLQEAGRGSLLEQIRAELARLFAASTDTGGEWRPVFIPLDSQENSPLATLLLKNSDHQGDRQNNEGQGDEDGEADDQAQRFLIEVDFSILGPVQLDGRILGKQFDLKVWSHQDLGEKVIRDLKHLFTEALDANGFAGRLDFERTASFPVDAATYLPS